MKHLALNAALLVAVACGGNEATKAVAPTGATPQAAPLAPAAPGTPATAPEALLALSLSVERSPDGAGLRVVNRGSEAVSLAPGVALEQRQGEAYRALSPHALTLRFDCASQGCVTLAPGAELAAPAWLGRADGERCDALARLPGIGSYRFVVKSCSGGQAAELAFEQSTPP